MPKVLIVDDEPLICQSFEWVFAKGDVQVISANTKSDGLTAFRTKNPMWSVGLSTA